MLSGLSFRLAFVFSISSLILSGWSQYRPQSNFKNLKTSILSSLIVKRCTGVKIELKPHYQLVRGFTFLCVQLSKNITKCFFKKILFLVLILQSTSLICITWKRKQTTEKQPHRACEWMKSNKNKKI